MATRPPTDLHPDAKCGEPNGATVVGMTVSTTPALPVAAPFVLAVRDTASVAVGIASFGVTLGVTMSVLGFGALPGLVGAVGVYGGSAQLTAVTLLGQGTALLAAVASAAVVNSRLLLYGAALSARFRDQPAWFAWTAPQFVIDQTFLLADARPELAERRFRQYWGWLGTSVLVVWTSSITVGLVLGPLLPPLPHLQLVGTALFLGMLMPRLTNRPAVVAAVVGGLTAAAVGLVRPELGILCGALSGVAAGTVVRR